MKKKLAVFVLALMSLTITAFAEVTEVDYTSAKLNGEWMESDQTGYRNAPMQQADAALGSTVTWSIKGGGTYRLYYWKGIDPIIGAKNGIVSFSSEGFEKDFHTDFTRGNAGWNELGIVGMGTAGGSLKISAPEGTIFASAIKYELLDKKYSQLYTYMSNYPNHVLLQTGSDNAYINGCQYKIPDTTPVVVDGTTFVPLRFISEALGADVSWDGATSTATVSYNGTILSFTINSKECFINSAPYTLSQAVYMENGRTMLPLRFISEAFNKKVFWCPAGVISITETYMPDAEKDSEMLNTISRILRTE